MALPPDLEAKIQACEARVRGVFEKTRCLATTVDELIAQIAAGEIDVEASWEDPSIVRHVEELRRTADRVRRESGPPAVRAIAGANGRR